MQRQIQQIEIDGQSIWVEVEEVSVAAPISNERGAGRFGDTSADRGVGDALKKIDLATTLGAVVAPVRKALSDHQPDEVCLELTLGFKAEVGVFITSGEANAQVKVSAKWKAQTQDKHGNG